MGRRYQSFACHVQPGAPRPKVLCTNNGDGNPFKALAYTYSGDCAPKSISLEVRGVAPNVGKPAAVAQELISDLPAPQAISPADNSSFNQYRRETTLQ
jgi:hypothetical protein